MARYELAENEFRTIEPLIHYKPARGRTPTQVREMFNAILWMLCSGAKWRDLPERYPPWKSACHRFRYYPKHGILEQVIETLLRKASQNRPIQLALACIDGSHIRAHQHAAGARKRTGNPRRSPRPNRRWAAPGAASPAKSTWSRIGGDGRCGSCWRRATRMTRRRSTLASRAFWSAWNGFRGAAAGWGWRRTRVTARGGFVDSFVDAALFRP